MQVLRGKLREIGFLNLLQLLHDSGMSGRLRIHTPHGEGVVEFSQGKPVFARFGIFEGIEALQELMLLEEGDFGFEAGKPPGGTQNLPEDALEHLLVSLAVGADEYRRLVQEIPLRAVPYLVPGLEDQELNLKGFHLRLITSFNGTTVEELARKLRTSRYRMLTALKELKEMGVVDFREDAGGTPQRLLTPEELREIEKSLVDAIGPMGRLILEEKMTAMGGSPTGFPRSKLQSLLEALAEEIPDPEDREQFLGRLGMKEA